MADNKRPTTPPPSKPGDRSGKVNNGNVTKNYSPSVPTKPPAGTPPKGR